MKSETAVVFSQVRRFVKYNLGEGLEKKSSDFAAEVAQQTQAKAAAPAPKKEEKKEEKKAEEPKKVGDHSAQLGLHARM